MAMWPKAAVGVLAAAAVAGLVGCAPRAPATKESRNSWPRRYVRNIEVPNAAEGEACVALVPQVYEHAASAAMNELAVFAVNPGFGVNPGGERTAVPFRLTESGTGSGVAETARVFDVRADESEVDFSLAMPRRAYSAVELGLEMKDFVGVAAVTGVDDSGAPTWLGQHVVFDETARGLGRSMRMELAEEKFPVLRVKLQLRGLDRRPWHGENAAAVTMANVPQSREAQTVYVTVARAAVGGEMDAKLLAPAHVPVERVRVEVEGDEDFLREVTVGAGEDVAQGTVERVRLPMGDGTQETYERLSLPAVLAANLRHAAEVRVRIGGAALPVRSVALEMRQRKVCFSSGHGARYELAYGGDRLDDGPAASTGDDGVMGSEHVTEAALGAEREDAGYAPPKAWKVWLARQPELLWVVALGLIAVLAARMRLHLRRRRVR